MQRKTKLLTFYNKMKWKIMNVVNARAWLYKILNTYIIIGHFVLLRGQERPKIIGKGKLDKVTVVQKVTTLLERYANESHALLMKTLLFFDSANLFLGFSLF